LEKIGKIEAALGLRPQPPVGLRSLRPLPPDLRVVTSIACYSYFLVSVFSAKVIKKFLSKRNRKCSAFSPISYFKLYILLMRAQNIFYLRAQGIVCLLPLVRFVNPFGQLSPPPPPTHTPSSNL